jgi:lipooligosaccharide transport system permease protein
VSTQVLALRGAGALCHRNLVFFRRSWKHVFPSVLEPLTYFIAVGLGLGVYLDQGIDGVSYERFLAVGLVPAAAMSGAGFPTLFDAWAKLTSTHVYDAVLTTPLQAVDIAVGELLWAMVRGLIYSLPVAVLVAALGHLRWPLAALAPLALVLTAAVFAPLSMVMVSLARTPDDFSYFTTLVLRAQFLASGVFFPVSDLPAAAQPVVWFTPLHHGVEMTRDLTLTGDWNGALAHAAWLAVAAAVVWPLALVLFRRRMLR